MLLIVIFLILLRHHKVIRAQSIRFSIFSIFGGILACLAILTWPIENNTSTCQARIWCWSLGFHCFLDPIIAKSRRIVKVFNHKLTAKSIQDKNVAITCCLLFLPQLILNIIWTSIAPLETKMVILDPIRPSQNYQVCDSSNSYGLQALAYLTIAYCSFLLLYSGYLALYVRLAYSLFHDAKSISVSVYTFSLGAFLILTIQLAISTDHNASTVFIIRSIIVLISYTSAMSILFIPQIYTVASGSAIYQYVAERRWQHRKSRLDIGQISKPTSAQTQHFQSQNQHQIIMMIYEVIHL